MQIINVPIKSLKEAQYNPRKMNEKEVKDLTESIRKFGLVEPIVVNRHEGRENVVVGGHQRLKIAQGEGFTEMPVVYVNLDEKSERELNLRLNKNLGSWDWDMLANFGEEELKEVGFTSEELDKAFGLVEEDQFDADAEYQKIEEPKTKLGDLYRLGNHRLLCGDSTKEENYYKLMNNDKAQLVFTDPPYNVGYDHTVTYVEGRTRKREKFNTFDDNKNPDDFTLFIEQVFKNCLNFSQDKTSFYCWHASKTEFLFRQGIERAGWYISQTIFWLKDNCTFSKGLDYLWILEPCYFGWKNKKSHFVNKKTDHDFKNVMDLNRNDYEESIGAMYEKRDAIKEYGHPTQKPVRLAERALKKHSNQGDIVLEPFNGSGSTMMACEQLKRKCYAIELDPKFIDVAVKRFIDFTGKEVIRLNDGKKWSEIFI